MGASTPAPKRCTTEKFHIGANTGAPHWNPSGTHHWSPQSSRTLENSQRSSAWGLRGRHWDSMLEHHCRVYCTVYDRAHNRVYSVVEHHTIQQPVLEPALGPHIRASHWHLTMEHRTGGWHWSPNCNSTPTAERESTVELTVKFKHSAPSGSCGSVSSIVVYGFIIRKMKSTAESIVECTLQPTMSPQ